MSESKITRLLFGFIAIWAVLLILTCCSTEKKAQKKTAWLIAHDKLDDVCARVYPIRDSVITKDSIHFDTLIVETAPEIKTDTVYKNDTVFITQSVKCPPAKVITKTVHDSVFVYRTNTAEIDRVKGQVLAKEGQIKQKDDIIIKQQQNIDKDNWWKVAAIITWCLVFTGFVFRFFVIKKPI